MVLINSPVCISVLGRSVLRILLVDDHILFRQGLKFLLSSLDEEISFYEASSSHEALNIKNDIEIHLILLDLYMPDENGIQILEHLKQIYRAPIVVLSSADDPNVIHQTIDNGASGFIPKSSTQEELVSALKHVLAGRIYIPDSVLSKQLAATQQLELNSEMVSDMAAALESLSGRPKEALNKAIQGKANKVIAIEMAISESTVKNHLSSAFRTIGVKNRTQAVFVLAKLKTPQSLLLQ